MLSPMLIGLQQAPFDSPDFLFELKLDGERCLAFLNETTELHNKRGNQLLPKFPELSQIHRQVLRPCVLDGELMVQKDGVPDFFEVQRRTLLSNPFKIDLASKQYPASFVAFDILQLDAEDVTKKPLLERKKLLAATVRENERLAVSRYVEGQGAALYQLTEQNNLEGIVAKRRDSLYYPNQRTKDWIKIKNLQDDDFVVCGYLEKDKGITSLVLGQYDNRGILQYQGHVTLGVGGSTFDVIRKTAKRKTSPFTPTPPGNESAVWVSLKHVCTVKYMMRTQNGGLRQPVFKGLREDKTPKECVLSPIS